MCRVKSELCRSGGRGLAIGSSAGIRSSTTISGATKTPIARSSVVSSMYRYDRPSSQTNADSAAVVPTSGAWPTCTVCMPMRNVWARTPPPRMAVARRPTRGSRHAKCVR